MLRSSEKTQTTLIVVWLVEIYQNKLAALREGGGGAEVGPYKIMQLFFHSALKSGKIFILQTMFGEIYFG